MKRNLTLEIYAYLMIVVLLLITTVTFLSALTDLVNFINPEMGLSESQIRVYGHNDNYRGSRKDFIRFSSEQEVTQHRLGARQIAIAAIRHDAKSELITEIPFLFIFSIATAIHIRIARREYLKDQNDNNLANQQLEPTPDGAAHP